MCTTTKACSLSDLWGCEFTSDGTPWVAQRVCAIPTWLYTFDSKSILVSTWKIHNNLFRKLILLVDFFLIFILINFHIIIIYYSYIILHWGTLSWCKWGKWRVVYTYDNILTIKDLFFECLDLSLLFNNRDILAIGAVKGDTWKNIKLALGRCLFHRIFSSFLFPRNGKFKWNLKFDKNFLSLPLCFPFFLVSIVKDLSTMRSTISTYLPSHSLDIPVVLIHQLATREFPFWSSALDNWGTQKFLDKKKICHLFFYIIYYVKY